MRYREKLPSARCCSRAAGSRRSSSCARDTSRTTASSCPTPRLEAGSSRSVPRPASCWRTCPARTATPGSSAESCRAPTSPIYRGPGAAFARAGLQDVRIHDLRHSYASRALALDESLTMIGKLLGHTQGRPPRGMLTLRAIRSKTPPRGSPEALETISWAARASEAPRAERQARCPSEAGQAPQFLAQ